jgi:protein SCO1/2
MFLPSALAKSSRVAALLGLVAGLLPALALAQSQKLAAPSFGPSGTPVNLPPAVRELGFDQNVGEAISTELRFVDHEGRTVVLGDFFGERPVLLAPAYFECPMLCSLVLDGVVRGAQPLSFLPGQDFEIVTVSFDPGEGPAQAAATRKAMLSRYRREGSDAGWHFLTGEQDQISQLMAEIGFRYEYDPERDVFNHVGGVVLLTPDGTISRYLLGVDFATKDLRLGLVEASRGEIGSVVDQVLLYCYQYDPETGKYSVVTMNVIRVAGLLTVLALVTYILLMLRWERVRQRALTAANA